MFPSVDSIWLYSQSPGFQCTNSLSGSIPSLCSRPNSVTRPSAASPRYRGQRAPSYCLDTKK